MCMLKDTVCFRSPLFRERSRTIGLDETFPSSRRIRTSENTSELSIYIYIYIYKYDTYIYIYIYICICIYVCVHGYIIYVYALMNVLDNPLKDTVVSVLGHRSGRDATNLCTQHVYIYIYIYNTYMYIHIYIYIYTRIYTYVYIYIYIYICMRICNYTYMFMYASGFQRV